MPNDWWRKCLAELIGTFTLVFICAGSAITGASFVGDSALIGIALANGLVVGVVVSSIAGISGGHINPAVTVAFMLVKRTSITVGTMYIGSQLLGCLIAAGALMVTIPEATGDAVDWGATLLNSDVTLFQGVSIEAILTFLLVFSVYGTVLHPKSPRLAGFGIGAVVAFDILMGGPLTGASMNPARSFGPALISAQWISHWVYWVGPIVGAVAAAFLFEYIFMRGNSTEE